MDIVGAVISGAASGLATGLVAGALAAKIIIKRNTFSVRQESRGANSSNYTAGKSIHKYGSGGA